MQAERKRELDKLLGNFFFGCNIPFVIVESVHFRNFIHALNPEYVPPTRKTLSNEVLNTAYNELQDSVATIETRYAVLLIDGYKNKAANTKNVVAMLLLDEPDNRKYIFLNSWNFSNRRETAEELAEVVEECIVTSRDRYNLEVYLVISDNVACMIRMGRMIDIWHVTCHSHSGNLLAKSLVDHAFATRVNNLLKEFKNPCLETQLLDAGGNRMVLIAETRWCTHRDAFRRALRNLPLMRNIAENQQINISQTTTELLLDQNFEILLQDNILILDPVCELINKCQRADCTIADAIQMWLRLEIPVNNEQYERIVQERKEKAITKYGLAANFLHPTYRGRAFANNPDYVNIAHQFFIDHLSHDGVQQLEQYVNEDGLFRVLFQRNYQSGLVFWKSLKDFYPELSELAIKLHLAPASTGQLERLFSEWAYVHNSKRNRLTSKRSIKLISIYYDKRFNDQVMMNDIDDFEEDE